MMTVTYTIKVQPVYSGANWESSERRQKSGADKPRLIPVDYDRNKPYSGLPDMLRFAAVSTLESLSPQDREELDVLCTAMQDPYDPYTSTRSWWYRNGELTLAEIPAGHRTYLPLATKCMEVMKLYEDSFIPAAFEEDGITLRDGTCVNTVSIDDAIATVGSDDLEKYLLSNLLSDHLWNDTYAWAEAIVQYRDLEHPDDAKRRDIFDKEETTPA